MEMSPWLCVLTAQKVNQTSPLAAYSARSADSLSLKVQNFPPGRLPWRSFGRRVLPPGVGPKSAPGGGRTFGGSSVFASSFKIKDMQRVNCQPSCPSLKDCQPVTTEHDEVMHAFLFPLAIMHVHQSQDTTFERIFELLWLSSQH